MRRHAVGIIALVLLAFALGLTLLRLTSSSDIGPLGYEAQAACLRIGIVMALVWLAYRQLERIPTWIWYTFPPAVVVLAIRPRMIVFVGPLLGVLVVLAMLKPGAKPRKARRQPRRSLPED